LADMPLWVRSEIAPSEAETVGLKRLALALQMLSGTRPSDAEIGRAMSPEALPRYVGAAVSTLAREFSDLDFGARDEALQGVLKSLIAT